jgi:integrase
MTRPHKRKPGQTVSSSNVSQHYRALLPLARRGRTGDRVSPFRKMRPPTVHEQRVDTEDQLWALLQACNGRSFENRRDLALIRLFLDTGARRAEVAALDVADIDFDHHVAWVIGKGNRPRALVFGDRTAEALRRYLRARAKHPSHASPEALTRACRAATAGFDPSPPEQASQGGRGAEGPSAPVPAHVRSPLAR